MILGIRKPIKLLFLIMIILIINGQLFGEYEFARYKVERPSKFTGLIENYFKNDKNLTDNEKINKLALLYEVPVAKFKECYNKAEKMDKFWAPIYLSNKILRERTMTYYLQFKDFNTPRSPVFFDDDSLDTTVLNYTIYRRSPYQYPKLPNVYTMYQDTLLFHKFKNDKILVDIISKSRGSHDLIYQKLIFHDKAIFSKYKIKGDTLFIESPEYDMEPLFLQSEEPVEYMNHLGKFFYTGEIKNVTFFKQFYDNVFQTFWIRNVIDEIDEPSVILIWFNKNFEIIRLEDITYDEGFYQVYSPQKE